MGKIFVFEGCSLSNKRKLITRFCSIAQQKGLIPVVIDEISTLDTVAICRSYGIENEKIKELSELSECVEYENVKSVALPVLSRMWLYNSTIKISFIAAIRTAVIPLLKKLSGLGYWVFLNRFYQSTYVFQGFIEKGNIDLIRSLNDEILKDLDMHRLILMVPKLDTLKQNLKNAINAGRLYPSMHVPYAIEKEHYAYTDLAINQIDSVFQPEQFTVLQSGEELSNWSIAKILE